MKKLITTLAALIYSIGIAQNPICQSHPITISAIQADQPTQTYVWNAITLCTDLNITLKANGADSYVWRDGSTTEEIIPVIHYASNPFSVIGYSIENGTTCESTAYIAVYGCYEAFYNLTGINEQVQSQEVKEIKYFLILGTQITGPQTNTIYTKCILYKDGSVKTSKVLTQ